MHKASPGWALCKIEQRAKHEKKSIAFQRVCSCDQTAGDDPGIRPVTVSALTCAIAGNAVWKMISRIVHAAMPVCSANFRGKFRFRLSPAAAIGSETFQAGSSHGRIPDIAGRR
jgi:hypothetical protein